METMRLPGRTWRCVRQLLLLASLAGTTGAWAVEAPHNKVKFNLPSDEFPKAILEFYRQSKIEVLFLSKDALSAIHTHPVVGEYEPGQALDIMLEGTGLVYNFATDHSVSIKQIQPPAEEQLPPPPPKKTEHHLAAVPNLVRGDMEMVTVTGSFIRVGSAADIRSPIVDVSAKDLSYAPFPTVQDSLYQLPIISLDAPREDLGVYYNYNWGSGINLRGLGVGATLVLVNGHRQPLSGLNSDFVDVSNIPAAAVDRVEILPQGASATYGSDAVAGVVNIILRDHFDGAQTSVRYGGAPGGRDNITVSQLLGTHWDSGNGMLVYEYQDSSELPISARGYAASANKAPYGGGDYRSFYTDPGNILDPNTYLPIYGGTTATSSTSPQLTSINRQNSNAQYDLFPQETQHSLYGTAREEIGSVELFAEGRFTQRSTYEQTGYEDTTVMLNPNNPFNPFPGSYTPVDYSFSKAFGPITFADETRNYVGTLGARFKLLNDWQATLSETYGKERLYTDQYNQFNAYELDAAEASSDAGTAFNPFGVMSSAVLNSIRATAFNNAASGVESTSIVADGSLFSVPSGTVKMAAGYERREESLIQSIWVTGPISSSQEPISNSFSRHVNSAFAELSVPVLGDASNAHSVPRLELTLAGRYDSYSDFGHTTNPEFSVRWTPVDSLKLRASWGRSFRAPKRDDLYDTSNNISGLAVLPDPKSSTRQSLVLAMQGNNPNLKPETAKSWTAGFDIVPEFDPEFALSLTYYSVDYTGQIAIPDTANPFNILTQESEWAAVITRNPTAAQIAAVCNRPDYQGSVASCLASTPAAIVDYRLANLASTQTNGLDLNVHQKLNSDVGIFDLRLIGNYVFHFDQQVTSASPTVDILNTFQNPLKFRFRAVTAWDRHLPEESGLGASLSMNFTNGYSNPGSPLLSEVGSLTTFDAQLRYHTAEGPGWLGGMDFAVNAVNVFNHSPPFADTNFGYDSLNFQPYGRVLSATVSKKW
jgi:iron complex outermembrane recepter protein